MHIKRRLSANAVQTAAGVIVESLEQRALLSTSGSIAIRVFLPPIAATSISHPFGGGGWTDSSSPADEPSPTDTSNNSDPGSGAPPAGGSGTDGSNDSGSDSSSDDDASDPAVGDAGGTGDSGSSAPDDSGSGDSGSGDSSGGGGSDSPGTADSGSDSSNDEGGGGTAGDGTGDSADSGDSGTSDPGAGDTDNNGGGDSSGNGDPGSEDSGGGDSGAGDDSGDESIPPEAGGTDAGNTGTDTGSGDTDTGGTDDGDGGGDTGSTPETGGSHGKKDTTAPTADVSVSDVDEASSGTLSVTVVYSDNKKVKAKSIDKDDLVVTGPNGTLSVKSVTTDSSSDAGKITAVYKIEAPAGSWDHEDNGSYSVRLGDGAVVDASGNEIKHVTKHFDVGIAAPPSDTTAPDISIRTSDVHSDGDVKVVVHYTDAGGIDLDTISREDLSFSGLGHRNVSVSVVDVDANQDRTDVTATYHLNAPGDAWDSNDNGTYTVTVNNRAMADKSGNRTSAKSGTFNVDIAAPQPIDDGFGGGSGSSSGSGDSGGNGSGSGSSGGNGGSGSTGGSTSGGGETETPPDDNSGSGTGSTGGSGDTGSGTPTGGVVDSTGSINFVAESVITQSDGRILLAGHGKTADGTDQAFLRRFNADGTLDLSFGSKGTVLGAVGGAWYAVTMQGADRIVVAGSIGGNFVVSRYDLSGQLDASFGSAGVTTIDFQSSDDTAYAAAIGADNRIVLAGSSGGNAAFTRLTPDGLLDDTFGQHGLNLFDLGTADDAAAGVAVQADGRIVAAGATDTDVAVIRLGADGEADTTFSGDGLLLVSGVAASGSIGKVDYSQGIALDSSGKILLANHSESGDFAITRIDTNGNVDSSFGDNGVRTIDMGGDDDADAIVVQETGEVLVIGTSLVSGTAKTAVAALDADGSIISSFGDNGKLLIDADISAGSGRELHVGDLVLRAFGARQPDGKLVIGTSSGSTTTAGAATSPLRRLIVPGSSFLPQGSKIGDVGIVDGSNQRLQFTDDDGTTITLTLKGGNGTVWKNGNKINLILNDGGAGLAATFKISGGDGRLTLGDVTVNGSLKSMKAKTADLTGVFCTTGQIGKITVGNITGATLCAGGSIQSIAALSISGAKLLSGTALGADARLGGTGSNADQITAASIGALKIAGAITNSIVGAGLNSVDGTYIDDDDQIVGGSQSLIRTISAKGGATNSHFVAGAFGSVKTPAKVDMTQDPQFETL